MHALWAALAGGLAGSGAAGEAAYAVGTVPVGARQAWAKNACAVIKGVAKSDTQNWVR